MGRCGYYAAPPPHLMLFVFNERVVDALDGIPTNIFHMASGPVKVECSYDVHPADAQLGYTLPQFAGLPHHKLTLWSVVDDLTPAQAKLSEYVARAPTLGDFKESERAAPIMPGAPLSVTLPPMLLEACGSMASKHKMDMTLGGRFTLLRQR